MTGREPGRNTGCWKTGNGCDGGRPGCKLQGVGIPAGVASWGVLALAGGSILWCWMDEGKGSVEPPFTGKKHRDKAALNWGSLSFISLVHYHRGGVHGGMQAGPGTVAESYVMVCRQRERIWTWRGPLKPQSPVPVTPFFQQGHTS